ncbi:hypothetical protein ACVU7I_17030 [Patulibacter sp. S7RM1-6]
MGLIYAITASSLLWLVLWALGWKSVDAAIPALALIVFSTAVWRILGYRQERSTETAGHEADAHRSDPQHV